MEKKRSSLRSQNTALRDSNSDLRGLYAELQSQVTEAVATAAEQRERIARIQRLDAEGTCAIHTLQDRLDSLHADIKFSEKIVFLRSYPGPGLGGGQQRRHTEMHSSSSSRYEERLDPFSFSKQERQRSTCPSAPGLGHAQNVVLSNKMARTIGFFYTLFLHCLVFLVLYKLAWSESPERDCAATCAKKFEDNLHGAAASDLRQ
uniref:CASP C-terminal domain-containing protein n=1 Tax=Oryctolagus cuniculus TaxID=9986 RepID=G1U0V3_RABIT